VYHPISNQEISGGEMIKLTCNACGYSEEPFLFHHSLDNEHDYRCCCGSTDIDTCALWGINPDYKYGANNTLKPMGRTK